MWLIFLENGMKKNVLVFATTYPTFLPWDATPPFVHELTKRLVSDKLEMIVLCPRRPGTVSFEVQEWVKIYRYWYFFRDSWERLADGAMLPNIKQNRLLLFQIPFFLLGWLLSLIRLIKKHKIKTIHCHWIITNWFLCALVKKYLYPDIKLIVTSHGWDAFLNKWILWKIAWPMKQFAMKYTDRLTVVSTAIKEVFTPLADEHSVLIDVMPMWVDSNTFHPDNYNEKLKWKYNIKWPLLLFVGRLAEKKWVTYLLDAMPSVLKEYPDAKLLIVWWWPLEFILKNQSKELWLENSVIFTWPIPNWELPKYYATADLFIWPSIIAKDGDSEWFWLVFVEALMSGTPIIWSNLLWIKDILINEENWLFIKQKSAIDIYDSISWILSLDNLILRRSVLKYSRKNVSEKFYTIVK